jgi:DNA-binding MarR family transcriptional regulator
MARSDSGAKNGQAQAKDAEITLGVLAAIEADSAISQRTLSSELGVALGLANAYLKRCVKKGYVKIAAVPRRRYAYFLTPQGFAEKARLTGEYLTSSLQFFRRARMQLARHMATCSAEGYRRIALAGASEIAEIATITAHDHDITIVGVIDARHPSKHFCGLPVVKALHDLERVDAVIITGTERVGDLADAFAKELGRGRIFIPELVQIGRAQRTARSNGANTAGSAAAGK